MNILLNEVECRVLGSLIEKEITTPEYYPLSLNALVNACNQKSNRDPVMNLDEAAARQALHSLDGQSLVRYVSAADSRVTKYEHRLQEAFNFYRHEVAILCVLLLRGPQTPGELRTRAERTGQGSSPAARDQGGPLRTSFVRRRGGVGCQVSSGAATPSCVRRRRTDCSPGEGSRRTSQRRSPLSKGDCGPATRIRPVQEAIRVGSTLLVGEPCCRPY